MMNKPKIVLFESYYHLFHGNSRYLTLLAQGLGKAGFKVVLYTAGEGPLADRARQEGHEVIVLPYPPALNRFGKGLVAKSLLKLIKAFVGLVRYNTQWFREVRLRNYEIIHCTSIRSLFSAGIGARLAGASVTWVIQMEYSIPVIDTLGLLLAHRIIFIAPRLRLTKNQLVLRLVEAKVRVVPFGVDLDKQIPDRSACRDGLRLKEETFVIGTAASIVPNKGIHILIEVVAQLVKRGIDLKCIVVGGVPEYARSYREELQYAVEEEGIGDVVEFLGWRSDCSEILRALDLFVLPSLSEGLSRATVEAMWMECPVVAADTGAMADLIDNSVGRLVPKNDANAMAVAIESLATNMDLARALGRAGRSKVLEQFTLDLHFQRMEDLFLELSGSR